MKTAPRSSGTSTAVLEPPISTTSPDRPPVAVDDIDGDVSPRWFFGAFNGPFLTEEIALLVDLPVKALQAKFANSPQFYGTDLSAWLGSYGAPSCSLCPEIMSILVRRLGGRSAKSLNAADAQMLVYKSVAEFWDAQRRKQREAEKARADQDASYIQFLVRDVSPFDTNCDELLELLINLGRTVADYERDRTVVIEAKRLMVLRAKWEALAGSGDHLRTLAARFPSLFDTGGIYPRLRGYTVPRIVRNRESLPVTSEEPAPVTSEEE